MTTSARKIGQMQKLSAWFHFLIRPHLGDHLVEEINSGVLEDIATRTGKTIYALDDSCAVRVVGSDISVVGEGEWRIIH